MPYRLGDDTWWARKRAQSLLYLDPPPTPPCIPEARKSGVAWTSNPALYQILSQRMSGRNGGGCVRFSRQEEGLVYYASPDRAGELEGRVSRRLCLASDGRSPG